MTCSDRDHPLWWDAPMTELKAAPVDPHAWVG